MHRTWNACRCSEALEERVQAALHMQMRHIRTCCLELGARDDDSERRSLRKDQNSKTCYQQSHHGQLQGFTKLKLRRDENKKHPCSEGGDGVFFFVIAEANFNAREHGQLLRMLHCAGERISRRRKNARVCLRYYCNETTASHDRVTL